MSKFITVFVALFAIGSAAPGIQLFNPLVTPTILPIAKTVYKPAITAVAPTVYRSYIPSTHALSYIPTAEHAFYRSYIPTAVPASDLSKWESYKEKFGKNYVGIEDHMRRGIFFATKAKIAKYDELLTYGLGTEKLELDIFADYLRDELFSLRSILEGSQDEWDSYKLKYGKVYDSFEDRFRKTVYFIEKDIIEAHNKLFERGFSTYALGINQFTDLFHDELPAGVKVLPLAAPAVRYIL
ncbi:uncharacterized protein LOC116349588 [Contarinia nasturtii]|uniref:uncharacterized protein LOC116349588 n=1 Tax=Contarinia nasturtii TaxID=265458 RepID=UPI0012D3FB7E|nr:uncharacterized protein LOC116349588 [Contarinia nasturtii]